MMKHLDTTIRFWKPFRELLCFRSRICVETVVGYFILQWFKTPMVQPTAIMLMVGARAIVKRRFPPELGCSVNGHTGFDLDQSTRSGTSICWNLHVNRENRIAPSVNTAAMSLVWLSCGHALSQEFTSVVKNRFVCKPQQPRGIGASPPAHPLRVARNAVSGWKIWNLWFLFVVASLAGTASFSLSIRRACAYHVACISQA